MHIVMGIITLRYGRFLLIFFKSAILDLRRVVHALASANGFQK